MKTSLGGRPLGEILYPTFVRIYPWLYCMQQFEFEGKWYQYMFHPCGATLRGERIIEVPIVLDELRRQLGRCILEVDNILSHYVACHHDVVDRYEKHRRCIYQDILDFQPDHLYDFIISISTVEHIGWNESERKPDKAVRAQSHMRSLIAPGGRMLVTVPWGQNLALDRHLQSRDCLFDQLKSLKRVSNRNTWVQTSSDVLQYARHGDPYPFVNDLVLGYLTAPGKSRA